MSKRGGFFAIDRRTWSTICDQCSIGEMAAYLVMAQGTGACNRETAWSTKSLKTYAGIAVNRGTEAIDGLTQKGFVTRAEASTRMRPRYEIRSYAEWHAGHAGRIKAQQQEYVSLLSRLRTRQKLRKHEARLAQMLIREGLVAHHPDDSYSAVSISSEPDFIWLPNEIVTGAADEESPVKRLRSGGDTWTLRLFVDLYYEQNLRDDCGISPMIIWENYTREQVGERGQYIVWGFRGKNLSANWAGALLPHQYRPKQANGDSGFWVSVRALQQQGLLTFVPHLWDQYPANGGEVLHAYGIYGAGEQPEREIGTAAHSAAQAMVPDWKLAKGDYCHLAPIVRTMPNVQMVGVARLRYRPKTRRTRAWWSELSSKAPSTVATYEKMGKSAESFRSASA